ncbi:Com family DNA-binding transcriptional regulator [Peribacillus sp. TH16]|nr:Com family DNA-binding transcriptional regulator [Peribacillus sp. TH16]MBK5482995.1 Com family DNA-binding transcriptional regulator [Peribacillus sp. TH16]
MLKEIRCTNSPCKHLLCKGEFQGVIEFKCPKCKNVHTVKK